MRDISSNNFGLLIAYVIPGVTALVGTSEISQTVAMWLTGPASQGPTIGGFLYVSLAAVAAGLTVSTVRWGLIDTLHHITGIRKPLWDFSKLQSNLGAFDLIVEHQYRYYQFHANEFVAIVFLLATRRFTHGLLAIESIDLGLLVLACIFFVGSRDTLRRYYVRGDGIMAIHRQVLPTGGECTADAAKEVSTTPVVAELQPENRP